MCPDSERPTLGVLPLITTSQEVNSARAQKISNIQGLANETEGTRGWPDRGHDHHRPPAQLKNNFLSLVTSPLLCPDILFYILLSHKGHGQTNLMQDAKILENMMVR
jgi:hypothetical protein